MIFLTFKHFDVPRLFPSFLSFMIYFYRSIHFESFIHLFGSSEFRSEVTTSIDVCEYLFKIGESICEKLISKNLRNFVVFDAPSHHRRPRRCSGMIVCYGGRGPGFESREGHRCVSANFLCDLLLPHKFHNFRRE